MTSSLRKQIFWDIYQKLEHNPTTLELFGTGNESRDYIFVTDLVMALECVIQKADMLGEFYNLASGIETTIREAVGIYIGALRRTTTCKFNNKVRPGDPLNWRADISKIKKLGFLPVKDLAGGLAELATWIAGNRGRDERN